jgi:hypothetical protein
MTGAVPAKAFAGHATNQRNLAERQRVDAVRPLQRRIKDAQQWLLLLAGSGRSNQSMKQHIGKRVRPKQLYIQLVTATGTAPAGSVDQAAVRHTCYCLAALPWRVLAQLCSWRGRDSPAVTARTSSPRRLLTRTSTSPRKLTVELMLAMASSWAGSRRGHDIKSPPRGASRYTPPSNRARDVAA